MRSLRSSVGRTTRSFFSPPAFFRPALAFLAAGAGVVVAVLGNLETHLAKGLGVSGLLRVDVAPQAEFGIEWSRRVQGAVPVQEAGASHLLLVLCGLCLAAVVVLGTSLLMLLAGRWRARAHGRAIRIACGASGIRIRMEDALGGMALTVAGGSVGLALGYLGKVVLALTWPHLLSASPFHLEVIPLLPVLGAFLIMVPAVALVREVPSGRRGDLTSLLGGGNRLVGGRYPEGLKGLLPALQIGLSVSLLMGSSVVLRGVLDGGGNRDAGRVDGDALVVPVVATVPDGEEGLKGKAWTELLSDLRGVPGVREVALFTPGAWIGVGPTALTWTHCGACRVGGMWVPFYAPPVRYHVVSPDSFRAMNVSVTRGRDFTSRDGPGAPRVAVVNASYAQQHFDAEGPLGRSIRLGVGPDAGHTVVGVVEDFGIGGVGSSDTPRATVFVSALQHPPDRADLFLVPGDGTATATEVEYVAEAVESGGRFAPAREPVRLNEYLARTVSPLRWFAGVALALGLLTLAAAAFGVYSLAHYSVHLRVGEIGVRRALGAGAFRIAALVLGRSAKVLILGAFLGLEGALLLHAGLQEVVSQEQGFDLRAFAWVMAVMTVAVVVGTLSPARKASRVPPGVAMGGGW